MTDMLAIPDHRGSQVDSGRCVDRNLEELRWYTDRERMGGLP